MEKKKSVKPVKPIKTVKPRVKPVKPRVKPVKPDKSDKLGKLVKSNQTITIIQEQRDINLNYSEKLKNLVNKIRNQQQVMDNGIRFGWKI